MNTQPLFAGAKISPAFSGTEEIILHQGDALEFLRTLPNDLVSLVVTSPPYNLGKEYERKRALEVYLEEQSAVVQELVRVLRSDGSVCWQVGNFVAEGEVFPLDILFYDIFKARGLRLRNRIIWHFGHGLHASRRFSGRYESVLWFTKTDEYVFNLDEVRIPAKYPGKTHFKGPKRGRPSGNPLGKNPTDVWAILENDWDTGVWDIPNVKANHPEKTIHPCQFPVELVERCVLALTRQGDWVLDPYAGVGSALIAGLRQHRRVIGCEKEASYVSIAGDRIEKCLVGKLKVRRLGTPVYQPTGREKVAQRPREWEHSDLDDER
jgi:DNA modification methylase